MSEIEQWRDVVGYEGLYEVSNIGNVRSLDREVRNPTGGGMRLRKGRLLRHSYHKHGYPRVSLYDEGIKTTVDIHRLVAEAFIDNPDNHPFVLHNDDNPKNNSVDNLRWGNCSDNGHDAVRNGRHHCANKTHCSRNHPLEYPNLVVGHSRKGTRGCLACNRALSHARLLAAKRGYEYSAAELQQLADQKYAEISAAQSAVA